MGVLGTGHRPPSSATRADESDGEDQLERAEEPLPEHTLIDWLTVATDRRMGALLEAFRRGWSIERVHELTRMTLVPPPLQAARGHGSGDLGAGCCSDQLNADDLRRWKAHGFWTPTSPTPSPDSCRWPHVLPAGRDEAAVMARRHALQVHPVYRMVDSCAAEFAAATPYYYSTYEPLGHAGIDLLPDLEARTKERVVAIGSGPIRIGQGIEFDYGCVHAVNAIRGAGKDAVLINNNPETVSTDFDTSDRLYFEPLILEHVAEVLLREQAHGILLQFGGQTAINLALPSRPVGPCLRPGCGCGHPRNQLRCVDEASDRERFEAFAKRAGLRMPRGATGTTPDDVRRAVESIGFVLIRPSYVLGGRAWRS